MRARIRFIGAVILRMGFIFMGASLAGLIFVAYTLLNPSRPISQAFDRFMAGWLSGSSGGLESYTPNEFVFDYTLGQDVPRLYYLEIPKLGLSAPVVEVSERQVVVNGTSVSQLFVPNAFAVGWSRESAAIGARGNSVLVGHNNVYGEVFKNLWDLQVGDEIIVKGASDQRVYRVSQSLRFEEQNQSLDTRLDNAGWLDRVPYEQLTLITCWPYLTNTYRVVVVALPV